jgi:hypothetical protein
MVAGGMYAAGRNTAQRAYQEREQEARIADLEAQQRQAAYQAPPQSVQPSAPPPQTMVTPPPAGMGTPGGQESIETLRELAKMRNEGLLTDEEFQRAKDKLLS